MIAMKKKKYTAGINNSTVVGNIFLNILLIAICLTCVYPILMILGTSFTSETALNTYGYGVIPKEFSLDAYKYVFTNAATILHAYGVTIATTAIGTFLHVLVCALYGYAVSRKEFRYRKQFTFFQFFTMLFSGGLVPFYLVCTRFLHINDTYWALILPMACSAWNIIILKTFFATTVPDAIIESARIDGASEFRIFCGVVLPIAKPGLATIALFALLAYWNNYMNALLLTSSAKYQNLQLYLYNMIQNAQYLKQNAATLSSAGASAAKLPAEGVRMAICILSIAPIIFAYPFFQKYFIQGLTIGAVKG